jgi:hypothetical protein
MLLPETACFGIRPVPDAIILERPAIIMHGYTHCHCQNWGTYELHDDACCTECRISGAFYGSSESNCTVLASETGSTGSGNVPILRFRRFNNNKKSEA